MEASSEYPTRVYWNNTMGYCSTSISAKHHRRSDRACYDIAAVRLWGSLKTTTYQVSSWLLDLHPANWTVPQWTASPGLSYCCRWRQVPGKWQEWTEEELIDSIIYVFFCYTRWQRLLSHHVAQITFHFCQVEKTLNQNSTNWEHTFALPTNTIHMSPLN